MSEFIFNLNLIKQSVKSTSSTNRNFKAGYIWFEKYYKKILAHSVNILQKIGKIRYMGDSLKRSLVNES